GEDDAADRGLSGMLLALAVDEEAAAAEHGVGGIGGEREHEGAVCGGVDGAADRVAPARQWALVMGILHRGIVLALVEPGIAGGEENAITAHPAALLLINPHEKSPECARASVRENASSADPTLS